MSATGLEEGFSIISSIDPNDVPIVYFCGFTTSTLPTIPLCHQSDQPYFQNQNLGKIDGFLSKIVLYSEPILTNHLNNLDNEIQVYPNPSQHEAILVSDLFLHNKEINIVVFDSFGRCVHKNYFRGSLSVNKIEVDLSNNPPGLYFIKVSSNNITCAIKLIKI